MKYETSQFNSHSVLSLVFIDIQSEYQFFDQVILIHLFNLLTELDSFGWLVSFRSILWLPQSQW